MTVSGPTSGNDFDAVQSTARRIKRGIKLNYLHAHLGGVTIKQHGHLHQANPHSRPRLRANPYFNSNYAKNPGFSRWNQNQELHDKF